MKALSDSLNSFTWSATGSPDGSAIAGDANLTGGGRVSYLWTYSRGLEFLPTIGPSSFSPTSVADDGAVVVGDQSLWTPNGGLRSAFDEIAPRFDIPFAPPNFIDAGAVSGDGNMIVGSVGVQLANGPARLGYIYTIANPCPADLNGDSVADYFDLIDFLLAYNAGDYFADENLDGRLDFSDVQQYLASLSAGCP